MGAVLTDGLITAEAACAEVPDDSMYSTDVILNIIARQREPGPALTISAPEAFKLGCKPVA